MKELDYEFKWETDRNAACDLCAMFQRKTLRLGICGLTRGLVAENSVCNQFINVNFRPRPNEEK